MMAAAQAGGHPERWKVLVTGQLPEGSLSELNGVADIDIWAGEGPMPREEMLGRLKDKDAVICLLSDRLDTEAMDRAPLLKAIATYSVGYDNIDMETATSRSIPVFNTPDVLTEATADLAFALVLSTARRLGEAERFVRSGTPWTWGPKLFLGRDVHGASLGVVGAGKIGSAVLRRGRGFGMDLNYADSKRNKPLEDETGAVRLPLDDLLSRCDIVSLHVPLTPSTRHLIGKRELSLMKEGSLLVNTSRGPVVDEDALVEALGSGRLSGAGLDVHENEPRVHPGLLSLENVVLLPHIGSATVSARTAMGRLAAGAIARFIKGGRPENTVNPSVFGQTNGGA